MKIECILLTLTLFCFGMFLSGCHLEPKGFVQDVRPGMTAYDSKASIYRSVNLNGQMGWQDWDMFWMVDRPSRLTYLRVR